VHDLVVTDSARGQGAGRALLSKAEDLARKRGCFRMALVTAAWRQDAIAFYEREGWANYGEWFVKPLADDVGPSGMPIRDDT
jgi:GNAT superfamily N-acetyltransferase